MTSIKIYSSYRLIWIIALLISSCASQKEVKSNGNDFPIIEVKPIFTPVSIYACESIVKNTDTTSINSLLCTDSTRFSLLFQEIKDYDLCIDKHVEGTTYYSVKIDHEGGFESIQIVREVDNCFKKGTNQIESILSRNRVLEQRYFNSELIFYHKFRIKKVD